MECGSCGSFNARYFTHLGVTSVRCPDCGADLMPGVKLRQGGCDKGECRTRPKNTVGELKSCPFCGGKAELRGGPEDWKPTFSDPDSGGEPYAVVCNEPTCGAGLYTSTHEAEEAVTAWNRRAEPEPAKVNTDTFLPTCPTCGETMIASGDGKSVEQRYCYKCGQKVHW